MARSRATNALLVKRLHAASRTVAAQAQTQALQTASRRAAPCCQPLCAAPPDAPHLMLAAAPRSVHHQDPILDPLTFVPVPARQRSLQSSAQIEWRPAARPRPTPSTTADETRAHPPSISWQRQSQACRCAPGERYALGARPGQGRRRQAKADRPAGGVTTLGLVPDALLPPVRAGRAAAAASAPRAARCCLQRRGACRRAGPREQGWVPLHTPLLTRSSNGGCVWRRAAAAAAPCTLGGS